MTTLDKYIETMVTTGVMTEEEAELQRLVYAPCGGLITGLALDGAVKRPMADAWACNRKSSKVDISPQFEWKGPVLP